MKAELKTIERTVTQLMAHYGEKFSVDGDEDQFKKFFAAITNFYRSLRTATDDNIKRLVVSAILKFSMFILYVCMYSMYVCIYVCTVCMYVCMYVCIYGFYDRCCT